MSFKFSKKTLKNMLAIKFNGRNINKYIIS